MYDNRNLSLLIIGVRDHFPHLIPACRAFYGTPSRIFILRERGELRIPIIPLPIIPPATDTDDTVVIDALDFETCSLSGDDTVNDIVEDDDAATQLFKIIRSCRGGAQGCPLASFFCILPYHLSLHETVAAHPTLRVVAFADDTYLGDDDSRIYPGFAAMQIDSRASCLLDSNLEKVVVYSPKGSLSHAPAHLSGSPSHPNGRIMGFKCVGGFIAEPSEPGRAWQSSQLHAKLSSRLAPLNVLSSLRDSEAVTVVTQLQYRLLSDCASRIAPYWMQLHSPDVTLAPVLASDDLIRTHWEQCIKAASSPSDVRDRSWSQAQLPICLGGLRIGGNAPLCSAVYSANFIKTWLPLSRTCPLLASFGDIRDPLSSAHSLPMVQAFVTAYETLRLDRDAVQADYEHFDAQIYTTVRSGKWGRYHPARLPPAKALPDITQLFDPSSKSLKPAQRKLALVVHSARWLELLSTVISFDLLQPHPTVRHRETSRFISVSQPYSGSWLSVEFDRTNKATYIPSAVFTVATQRRLGLYLSCGSPVFTASAAAGLPTDYVGDAFCNGGEHNRRHGACLRASSTAVASRAIGPVVLGDKSDEARTCIFNEGHVVDFAHVGGDPHTAADQCWEIKVPSPCTQFYSAGHGSSTGGGKPASVGHLYAFGNTEEFLRVTILGCAGRGCASDGPFDHSTGTGWVVEQRGDYHDAIFVKGNSVVTAIVEVFGGFTPRFLSELRRLARLNPTSASFRDGTKYGDNPRSPISWLTHHSRLISLSVVKADAFNILNEANRAKISLRSASSICLVS